MALMLTAASGPGDRVSGLTLGADDYLGKPFHFPELILRIHALARGKPHARPRTGPELTSLTWAEGEARLIGCRRFGDVHDDPGSR